MDESDKPALAQILPYVRKIAKLRIELRSTKLRADLGAVALDALAFGAVICAADGRIMFANAAAEALAHAGAGIVLGGRSKGIGAHLAVETRALRSLIYDASQSGAGGSIRLTGADGIAALLALVMPLPANLGGHRPGHALVALRSERETAAFREITLTTLFRLSPTQAAIALALYSGRTVEEIAAERGVSIATVRTHLQAIFARTGAENQHSLIRLLALLPPVR